MCACCGPACRTWTNTKQWILQPLGFFYALCGLQRVDLTCFRDNFDTCYLQFINFLLEAKRGGQHIACSTKIAGIVLTWLKADSEYRGVQYTAEQQEQHWAQMEVLASLKKQVHGTTWGAKPDAQQLRASGHWMEAIELVALVEGMKAKALQMVKDLLQLNLECPTPEALVSAALHACNTA